MKKLIIHYGMPKTGTTSIQKSLYGHLDSDNHYYLDTGRSNATGFLMNLLEARPERFKSFRIKLNRGKQGAVDKALCWNNLATELESANGRTVIMSAERFFHLEKKKFKVLADWLADRGGRQADCLSE